MLAAIVCLTIGATAQASHFRYGNITWRVPDPVGAPRTVEFTVTSTWRAAAVDGTALDFGDGVVNPFTTGATIGGGTDAAGLQFTVTQYTVLHTYATNGPFTAFFTSCCRLSNLSGGQADGSFRVETIVSLASGNTGGPVGQMPSIIQLQNGGTRTFPIPVFDPDADTVTCSFSTSAEMGGVPNPPAIAGQLPTVPGCVLTWNLTSAVAGTQVAVSVKLESTHGGVVSKSTVDFMVEVVNGPPPVCAGSGDFIVGVGQPFTNNLTGTSGVVNLTTNQSGAPLGSTFTPPIGGTAASPSTVQFAWTPTIADIGTRIVLVGFRTPTNLTGYCTMTLTVPQCAGFGNACSVGVGACESSGQIVCIGVNPVCSAVAGTPLPEVCDGIDNNCDGTSDEGNPGSGVACVPGLFGVCNAGLTDCQAGVLNCVPNILPGTVTETCEGTDQDCDGTVDNGFNVGTSCTSGLGQCQTNGQIVCDGMGGAVCDAVAGTPGTEICDGLDNDCDGTNDNGFNVGMMCTNGIGACQATGAIACDGLGGTTCDAVAGNPVPEMCGDAVDSDCDGFDSNGCPCADDNDCELCNEEYLLCVTTCANDADCPTGQVCDDGQGHLCVPACDADSDCAVVCDETSGKCVECTTDGECPTGQGCNAGGNCLPTCTNDNDCAAGSTCDTAIGLCVECGQGDACGNGEVCSAEANGCILPCNLEADCTNGLVCDESHGECVECVDDGDCATGVCNQLTNTCVECLMDGDCPTGEVCDEPVHTCVECVVSGDCTDPQLPVCDTPNNTCVECLENTDCDTGEVCNQDNTCGPPCTTDADCPMGVCDPMSGTCVECVDDSDCTAPETCNTTTHTCEPPVVTGCTNDSDCKIAEVCDSESAACIPGCRLSGTGNGCPDPEVCLDKDGGPIGQCGPEPTTDSSGIRPAGGGFIDCTTSGTPVGDAELPLAFLTFAGLSAALFRRRRARGQRGDRAA
jgi:Cys-rich repeat protein